MNIGLLTRVPPRPFKRHGWLAAAAIHRPVISSVINHRQHQQQRHPIDAVRNGRDPWPWTRHQHQRRGPHTALWWASVSTIQVRTRRNGPFLLDDMAGGPSISQLKRRLRTKSADRSYHAHGPRHNFEKFTVPSRCNGSGGASHNLADTAKGRNGPYNRMPVHYTCYKPKHPSPRRQQISTKSTRIVSCTKRRFP